MHNNNSITHTYTHSHHSPIYTSIISPHPFHIDQRKREREIKDIQKWPRFSLLRFSHSPFYSSVLTHSWSITTLKLAQESRRPWRRPLRKLRPTTRPFQRRCFACISTIASLGFAPQSFHNNLSLFRAYSFRRALTVSTKLQWRAPQLIVRSLHKCVLKCTYRVATGRC